MKKILMLLAFVVVSAMSETSYEREETLSQEERFEMLFGKTNLQFHEIRKSRVNRNTRNSREVFEMNTLTQDEKYEMLFGNAMPNTRTARTSRFIFPRQARDSIYVSFNF